MRSTSSLVLVVQALLFVASGVAEELRATDVPSACTAMCAPIVELTNTCDVDPNEVEDGNESQADVDDPDEAIEAQCICTNNSFDVASIAALCASCLRQEASAPVDDMDKIMSQCSFASMSYAPSATALVADVTVSATKPTTTGLSSGTSTPTSDAAATSASAEASMADNTLSAAPMGLVWSVLVLGLASGRLWL